MRFRARRGDGPSPTLPTVCLALAFWRLTVRSGGRLGTTPGVAGLRRHDATTPSGRCRVGRGGVPTHDALTMLLVPAPVPVCPYVIVRSLASSRRMRNLRLLFVCTDGWGSACRSHNQGAQITSVDYTLVAFPLPPMKPVCAEEAKLPKYWVRAMAKPASAPV